MCTTLSLHTAPQIFRCTMLPNPKTREDLVLRMRQYSRACPDDFCLGCQRTLYFRGDLVSHSQRYELYDAQGMYGSQVPLVAASLEDLAMPEGPDLKHLRSLWSYSNDLQIGGMHQLGSLLWLRLTSQHAAEWLAHSTKLVHLELSSPELSSLEVHSLVCILVLQHHVSLLPGICVKELHIVSYRCSSVCSLRNSSS
jgi:hypothetical protein